MTDLKTTDTELRALAQPLRCRITNNPVGTDTWMVGHPCQCNSCQFYLTASKERAELERQLEEARKPKINVSGNSMHCGACGAWVGDGRRVLWNPATNQFFCMGCESHASRPPAGER